MEKKIALLFAGQGAQSVGMGRDLVAHHPAAGDLFRQADQILGRSLSGIAWDGPLEELTKTSNCQPALYVHGLACLAALRGVAGDFPVEAAAGLSLGEWTAHAAGAATAGAMAAMIGADENTVRRLAADTDVDVANINAPGQIVISGESAKVELAVSLAKEHGIRRATLLNVAGAYHSRLMNSAYEQLGQPLLEAELRAPRFPIMSNVTGEIAATLPEIRDVLRDQVTSTVRWTDCLESLLARGCDLFIELGPGEILAGLLRRTRKDVDVISVSDPASVHACAERLREV